MKCSNWNTRRRKESMGQRQYLIRPNKSPAGLKKIHTLQIYLIAKDLKSSQEKKTLPSKETNS